MTCNGIELELNLGNAAFAERYEAAFAALQAACSQLPEGLAAGIRAQTAAVKALCTTLWGQDAYAALGLDPDDLLAHLDVVEAVVAEAGAQQARLQDRYAKYRPNRAERRAGGKR